MFAVLLQKALPNVYARPRQLMASLRPSAMGLSCKLVISSPAAPKKGPWPWKSYTTRAIELALHDFHVHFLANDRDIF
jgi:hypothetical protein